MGKLVHYLFYMVIQFQIDDFSSADNVKNHSVSGQLLSLQQQKTNYLPLIKRGQSRTVWNFNIISA